MGFIGRIVDRFKRAKPIWKVIIITAIVLTFTLIVFFILRKVKSCKKKTEKYNYSLDTQANAIEKFVMSYIAMENGDMVTQDWYNAGEFAQKKALLTNLEAGKSQVDEKDIV